MKKRRRNIDSILEEVDDTFLEGILGNVNRYILIAAARNIISSHKHPEEAIKVIASTLRMNIKDIGRNIVTISHGIISYYLGDVPENREYYLRRYKEDYNKWAKYNRIIK